MDVHTLRSTLREAGVADGYYWIEGVHEPAPTPPDFAYVRREGEGEGVWEVGVYERGRHLPLAGGLGEAEACGRLLRMLV